LSAPQPSEARIIVPGQGYFKLLLALTILARTKSNNVMFIGYLKFVVLYERIVSSRVLNSFGAF
jgi:hypothetical protein